MVQSKFGGVAKVASRIRSPLGLGPMLISFGLIAGAFLQGQVLRLTETRDSSSHEIEEEIMSSKDTTLFLLDESEPQVRLDLLTEEEPQELAHTVKHVNGKMRNHYDMNGLPPPVDQWLIGSSGRHHEMGSNTTAEIPRVINKIFLQTKGGFEDVQKMNPSLKEAHASWRSKNPGYKMRYFDLHRCRAYLADHYHPVFLRAFDCMQAFAAKADFFRYALVYREGGWYSDWKQVCLVSNILDRLAGRGTVWFSAFDLTPDRMMNAFFGAKPQHPILEEALRLALMNVKAKFYGENTLCPTGPFMFIKAYRKQTSHSIHDDDGVNLRTQRFNDKARRKLRVVRKRPKLKLDTQIGDGSIKLGFYDAVYFSYNGTVFIRNKCKGCGGGQGWVAGNDYNTLWKQQRYYCEDAQSLFSNQSDAIRIAESLEKGIGLWPT